MDYINTNYEVISFKKETLRTGVPTNRWFRDAHISDIRGAAPNTFMIYGLGQLPSKEKAIEAALIARDNGADAVYCGNSHLAQVFLQDLKEQQLFLQHLRLRICKMFNSLEEMN